MCVCARMIQLSTSGAGQSALDTSRAEVDRHQRDTGAGATGRAGQTGVNYKVVETWLAIDYFVL